MTTLRKGSTYKVSHRRKGDFVMKITDNSDTEWVSGVIIEGVANAKSFDNVREKNDDITVRRSFCKFTPMK